MIEVVVLLLASLAILALGVRIGMLAAPRIGRWADRDDEEADDD